MGSSVGRWTKQPRKESGSSLAARRHVSAINHRAIAGLCGLLTLSWMFLLCSIRLEPMLLSNIRKDPYFVKICREVTEVTALIDQIYYDVEEKEQCIQPWIIGECLDGAVQQFYFFYF